MSDDEKIKKNFDLHAEWMKYVFDNPSVLDRIPKGAVLVLLPDDDPELFQENYRILEENKSKGIPVFAVNLKTPKPHITKMEVVAA